MTHNDITIYYQNARGLRTKSHNFLSSVINSNYDLIFISETWLNLDFYSSEYFDSRYNVYRRDRYATGGDAEGRRRGGGVMVAARRELCVTRRDEWCAGPRQEEMWLTIAPRAPASSAPPRRSSSAGVRPGSAPIHIACVYFSHTADHYNSLRRFFDNATILMLNNPDDIFIFIGDFNITYATWNPQSDTNFLTLTTNDNNNAILLSDFMATTGILQFNSHKNLNDRILDLVLTNFSCIVTESQHPLVPEDPHHKALEICLTLSISNSLPQLKENVTNKPVFRLGDYEQIRCGLSETDWSCMNPLDCEGAVTFLYTVINNLILKFIPHRRINRNTGYPPWFSRALIKLRRKKLSVHKRWKTYHNPLDENEFKFLRKMEHEMETECYSNFISKAEDNIFKTPTYFWSFMKSKFPVNSIPDHISYLGNTSGDGQTISNFFNEYFNSVFVPVSDNTSFCSLSTSSNNLIDLSSVEITEDQVFNILKKLDISKGSGTDLIHPIFIKTCAKELATPLAIIFKKSMKEGHFPLVWKKALITPIYKSGDASLVTNYRPISKLNIFGKVFEKIVTTTIAATVYQHISIAQHGFYRGRSVDSNLLSFTDFVLNKMCDGWQVDAVYTDFSKCFDKINHSMLIIKLEGLGIHGDLLRWIKSYLSNRSQAVALKGYTSCFLPVPSGVPQGSHLGPLLFSLYVNDMSTCFLESQHLVYADDTKIYRAVSSTADCQLLQSDLVNFYKYCTDNDLYLNLDKCFIISFTRGREVINFSYNFEGRQIQRVTSIRDLGVTLDSQLTFLQHIDTICKRAYKQLGMILRIGKPFRRPCTYKILYNSFVRSILEFASVVWTPHYQIHIDRIERIQNIFLKSLCYRTGYYSDSALASRAHFSIPTLCNRRLYLDLIFFFKIIKNEIRCPNFLQNIKLRVPFKRCRPRQTLFYVSFARTNYVKYTFFRRVCKYFNDNLSEVDPFHDSLYTLKKHVRSKLLTK